MMKLPGISAGASRLAGATDESGGAAGAMKTMGNVLHLPQGGAAGARQENSDLSKVVEDLLHDKLMGKMNGSAGGGTDPLGSRHLPQAEGGQGPEVARPSFGGLQQSGGQSPLQGLQQENGDLKKLLQDLLKPGGSDGQAARSGAVQLAAPGVVFIAVGGFVVAFGVGLAVVGPPRRRPPIAPGGIEGGEARHRQGEIDVDA